MAEWYGAMSRVGKEGSLTLIEHVLVLLAFLSTSGGGVELVADAAEESSASLLLLVLVLVLGAFASTGGFLEKVHD